MAFIEHHSHGVGSDVIVIVIVVMVVVSVHLLVCLLNFSDSLSLQ